MMKRPARCPLSYPNTPPPPHYVDPSAYQVSREQARRPAEQMHTLHVHVYGEVGQQTHADHRHQVGGPGEVGDGGFLLYILHTHRELNKDAAHGGLCGPEEAGWTVGRSFLKGTTSKALPGVSGPLQESKGCFRLQGHGCSLDYGGFERRKGVAMPWSQERCN